MKLSWGGFEGAGELRSLPAQGEAMGFDTIFAIETRHDPFIQAAVIAEHTERAEIMTSIAVAFARTPALLAYAAHDLNVLSGGRFILGLGSQTKPHITRRFSMPWSNPADRMREMIRAIHAIWDSWYDGKPLAFTGEFYTHTLMTPYFTPTDTEFGRPRIHLAAVGPHMTDVAAEAADGIICHAFTTERYLREVTLPGIEAGLTGRARNRADFEITGVPFIACGQDEETQTRQRAEARKQIAFYGSTPSYRGVLDLHGWGALHEELHKLSRAGRWDEMGDLIDDDVLAIFAVLGTPQEAAHELRRRFDGLFDRISLGFGNDVEMAGEFATALKR
jgi:probable F420-dependent oxidoreductase